MLELYGRIKRRIIEDKRFFLSKYYPTEVLKEILGKYLHYLPFVVLDDYVFSLKGFENAVYFANLLHLSVSAKNNPLIPLTYSYLVAKTHGKRLIGITSNEKLFSSLKKYGYVKNPYPVYQLLAHGERVFVGYSPEEVFFYPFVADYKPHWELYAEFTPFGVEVFLDRVNPPSELIRTFFEVKGICFFYSQSGKKLEALAKELEKIGVKAHPVEKFTAFSFEEGKLERLKERFTPKLKKKTALYLPFGEEVKIASFL